MNAADDKNHDNNNNDISLSDRLYKAISSVESDPAFAVDELTEIQKVTAQLALISKNETDVNDIATSTLPFLTVEHYLAMAYTQVRTVDNDDMMQGMQKRFQNLQMACNLWSAFLQRLESFETNQNNTDDLSSTSAKVGLSEIERQQFHDLVELTEQQQQQQRQQSQNSHSSSTMMPPPPRLPMQSRDVKIARFKAKQQAEQNRQQLQALQARRTRLGIAPTDEMDGHDDESLQRSISCETIQMAKLEALEEWNSVIQEIPMITTMLQRHQAESRYSKNNNNNTNQQQQDGRTTQKAPPPPQSNKPLQLTHITQDSLSGQLQIRKEEVRSKVFQPGWNQPTMSLEELGEREVRAAMERDQRQKQAEAERKDEPRRFEDLKRDGMEDNADLVDASAALDRKWDDWKDENPRGSGNKRGDVGDRNF